MYFFATGPHIEGEIFSKRIGKLMRTRNQGLKHCMEVSSKFARLQPNYSFDPIVTTCFDHIFILKIVQQAFVWCVWVWATFIGENGYLRIPESNNAKLKMGSTSNCSSGSRESSHERFPSTSPGPNKLLLTSTIENSFHFAVSFQRTISSVDSHNFKETLGLQTLDLQGKTVSLRIPMCQVIHAMLCLLL